MCERGHGREPVSRGVTEAKGEEMGREAIRPDARWTTVMVDQGMPVRVNVPCDDHMEAFFITDFGLGQYKIIQQAFRFLFGREGRKVGTIGPADSIRTNNPDRRAIRQIKISCSGSAR